MKNFIKTISFMIVTVLILSSVLPVSIYASSVTTGDENNSTVLGAKTGSEDITIQVATTEQLRGNTGDTFDSDGNIEGKYIVEIPVVIDTYNSSYIKDASISFENSNFTVVNSEIANDKNIQSINNDVIKLNSSEIDDNISLNIPVSFKKADYVSEDYFNKNVIIKLSGTYVDKNGNEKTFNKQGQVNVLWEVISKEFLATARIVRHLEFTENNQQNLMVTAELTSGVKGGRAPEKEKTLEVSVPKINNINPELRISADKYTATEDRPHEKLTLTKNIEKNDNNEYKWDRESDVVYVTYIYRGINTYYPNFVENLVEYKATTLTLDSSTPVIKQATDIEVINSNNPIIVTATSTPSINRGAVISNTGLDTEFNVKYSLNIGYPSITNAIMLQENPATTAIKTKRISVSESELIRVLGDNGKIIVSFTEGTDTYEIKKNNTTITIPSGKTISKITTSKPTGDGTINVNVVKAVNSNDREALADKTKITGIAIVTNTGSDNSQMATACQWETRIEEPTQKVHFESNFKTLSTMKKNERMILSVVLESDSVDDYLFKNPALRIKYPSAIKTISNATVNVLYNDYNEFNENITPTINNADHTLVLQLTGTQTHYCESAVSKGILIQIVADYTLDRLAPTKDENINLEVNNANTGLSLNSMLQKAFKVVAPSQFIIQNKMEVTSPTNVNGTNAKDYFKESRETIEEDVEDIILPLYSNAKYVDVYGTVVNNQGSNASNVAIVGNFPSKNSNSYSGTQFNGTFDTAIIGGIRVENENERTEEEPNGTYKVYYSRNANESINSNGWTTTISEDAKSYKIEFFETFENTQRKDFHYRVRTPEDMTYNEHAKESFALLYGNGAISGEQYSYVESKPIGLATKPEADFDVSVSVKDIVKNIEIRNGDSVDEGAYLNVKISITNTSNRNIRDVRAVIELKQKLGRLEYSNSGIEYLGAFNNVEEKISEIKVSETKVVNKMLYVENVRDQMNEDGTYVVKDSYSLMDVQIYEGNELEFKPQEFKNKIESGTLSGITVSTAQDSDVGINDSFQQFFYIGNLTNEDIENVEIKGTLPKGIEYDSEANGAIETKGITYSYDSSSREYKIKIEKIRTDYITSKITLNLKAIDYGTYELKSKATAADAEINLNSINFTVAGKARNFSTTHTISTQTTSVKDTDVFYFNITITNHWDSEKFVIFKDKLDDNFVVKNCTILQNDQIKIKDKKTGLIEYNFLMQPNDVAEIRIKCGLKTQPKDTTINLTHQPTATCENVNIVINPITINVIGTGNFVNQNQPVIDGKYNISGTAWLDANNDGKRETTEQRISNISMKLIDNKTNKVAVDDNGNEQITTTSTNGEYIFTNVPVGSYVVVANYDSEKYGCGDYHTRNVAEDLNNDFIETEYEGKIVGATNNIIVQNTSISAIDLSLIPRNTFDMSLEKNVTNVSVTTSKGKEANYNFNSELAKVEISNEKDIKYYFVIEYTLTAKNVGYIDGYVKSVIDYIPKGMTFVQEDNPGWYVKADGYAYNNTLANTLIKAQKQAQVKIKLRKEMTAEQTGIIKNAAELGEVYNTEGIADINSKEANKDSSENDYSEALVVVALSTGGEIIKVAGIVFGVLALGVIILSITKIKRKKTII